MNEYFALTFFMGALIIISAVVYFVVNVFIDKDESAKKIAELPPIESRFLKRKQSFIALKELNIVLEPEDILDLLQNETRLKIAQKKLRMKVFW